MNRDQVEWHCPQCGQLVEVKQISTIVDGLVLIEFDQNETQVVTTTTRAEDR